MVVSKKVLTKVKDMGLNSYEAKIWTALLSRGVSTAGEISDIANVPRSRSYDVLESLEQKGFITRKIGKPIQYIALPPNEVIERLKKDIRNEAIEQVEVLEEFEDSSMLNQLKDLHDEGIENIDPSDITGCVQGEQNITSHITMMMEEAQESITYAGLPETEGIQEHLSSALHRDVTVRKVEQDNAFLITDRSNCLFYITDDTHKSYKTAIWVESEALAETFLEPYSEQVTTSTKITKTEELTRAE